MEHCTVKINMTYQKKPPSSCKDVLVKGPIKKEKIQINKKKLSTKKKSVQPISPFNKTKLSLSVCIFWYSIFYCQKYFLHFSQNCHTRPQPIFWFTSEMRQRLSFRIRRSGVKCPSRETELRILTNLVWSRQNTKQNPPTHNSSNEQNKQQLLLFTRVYLSYVQPHAVCPNRVAVRDEMLYKFNSSNTCIFKHFWWWHISIRTCLSIHPPLICSSFIRRRCNN